MTNPDNSFLQTLVAHIVTVARANGDKAPSERELAEHFNVSRGQVRESLARLRAPAILPAWNFMVDSAARARRPVNYETCAPGKVLPSP